MKKLFLLLFFLRGIAALGQQFTIFSTKQNIAFKEAENPMTIVVQGYSCKSVYLTTDNGKIQQYECNYYYRPATVGLATVKVWVKGKSKPKMIGQVFYRIHSIYPPVAFIGSQNKDSISLKVLKVQGGLRVVLLNSDYDAPFTVKTYAITALRDTSLVFSYKNKGAQYDSILIKKLDNLQAGDYIFLSNIISTGPDEKDYESTPLEFIIKK